MRKFTSKMRKVNNSTFEILTTLKINVASYYFIASSVDTTGLNIINQGL
jgi:hypothetical protein